MVFQGINRYRRIEHSRVGRGTVRRGGNKERSARETFSPQKFVQARKDVPKSFHSILALWSTANVSICRERSARETFSLQKFVQARKDVLKSFHSNLALRSTANVSIYRERSAREA